jgi:hypothetical protein
MNEHLILLTIIVAIICFFCILLLKHKCVNDNIDDNPCNIYKKYEQDQSEYILFKKICEINKANENDKQTIYLFIIFSLMILFGYALMPINKILSSYLIAVSLAFAIYLLIISYAYTSSDQLIKQTF